MGRVWPLMVGVSGSKSIWIQGPNWIFLIRVKSLEINREFWDSSGAREGDRGAEGQPRH